MMLKPQNAPDAVLRSLLLTIYGVAFLCLTLQGTSAPSVVLGVLGATLVPLWFGPLSLIGRDSRKWCEPTVLFNSGVFLYCLKGITLAFEDHGGYLKNMPASEIESYFTYVAVIMVAAMLCFNWSYNFIERKKTRARSGPAKVERFPLEPLDARPGQYNALLWGGVVIPTLVGAACFIIFFRSIGQDWLAFFRSPGMRSRVTDGSFGVASPLANFWRYGAYLMPLASIVWLTIRGVQKKPPHLALWLHLAVSAAIYVLIGGRSQLGGFVITVAAVYHYLFKPLRFKVFLVTAVLFMLYSYFIHVARFIGGTSRGDVLSALGTEAVDYFTMGNMFAFASGKDLVDIRLFPLIMYIYTHGASLELGSTFLGFFYGFVPRFLWPSKGSDLGSYIGTLVTGSESLSGTPAGFFPQMFMNFHFPGVILGGAVLGGGIAFLYRRWMLEDKSVSSFLKQIVLIPTILVLPFSTFENVLFSAVVVSVEIRFLLWLSSLLQRQSISVNSYRPGGASPVGDPGPVVPSTTHAA